MGHPPASEPDFSKQPDPKPLQLVVHAGPLAGKGFPITGQALTFGRDPDNDITLDDSEVSRHHARLLQQEEQIILEDLGSTNGTLVNGNPIVGQHLLQPADIISIGSSVFGVRGFAAPHTVGITQISREKPPFAPPPARPSSEPGRPSSKPAAASTGGSGLGLLPLLAISTLVIILVVIAGITAYFLTQGGGPVTTVPEVVITAPENGSQVQVDAPVTVQTTASDPLGVTRLELWVSNTKTAESISPAEGGQPTLTASFQWTPEVPGSYTLEVKAYNEQGNVGNPAIVTVNVVGGSPTPTDTPTASPTPETPTATLPTIPSLTTQTDLNVRAGPDTQYDILGLLPFGSTAEIIGRSEDQQWWQIRFDQASDGVGWVTADPAFATTTNTDNLPVIPAPPTPTPIPTDTPIPTNTPTATPVPPTQTPTPTPTPTATGEPTLIQFTVSPDTIQGGECVTISWNVTGVSEIYYEGDGVTGTGFLVDCPKESKIYDLRIVKKDGSEQLEERPVEVVNPIVSTGTIKVEPNQTLDLDGGTISGDDFFWNITNGTRHFETQNGVQLAPMRDISDLKNLTLAECAGASFGNYTFIDGSDGAPDLVNRLIPGRSACYRTNQGRLGKMRFPEASTGSLTVEWLTWR